MPLYVTKSMAISLMRGGISKNRNRAWEYYNRGGQLNCFQKTNKTEKVPSEEMKEQSIFITKNLAWYLNSWEGKGNIFAVSFWHMARRYCIASSTVNRFCFFKMLIFMPLDSGHSDGYCPPVASGASCGYISIPPLVHSNSLIPYLNLCEWTSIIV